MFSPLISCTQTPTHRVFLCSEIHVSVADMNKHRGTTISVYSSVNKRPLVTNVCSFSAVIALDHVMEISTCLSICPAYQNKVAFGKQWDNPLGYHRTQWNERGHFEKQDWNTVFMLGAKSY